MATHSVTVTATTLPESIPDFSLDTSRPGVQSVQTGSWSSASTWQGGQVPTSNHVVRILPGHTVTIADTSAVAYTIAIDGKLAFAASVNTRLGVTNLQVMAGEMGMGTPGVLEVGTAATPIAASVTAEIIIANTPLGGSVADPLQFGTGLMMLGKVSMHGSVKTPTFVRLATEPRAGHTTLTLSEAVSGWQVGDRLVLPDTRHIKESEVTGDGWINAVNQWEERTVQAISADGKTLTLNSGLQYDHLGARDLNGVLDFLPHVGNLTRNVIVRSESATGTRGHTIATHMAEVDIRYALFKDLGRTTYLPLNTTTNHIGRYPIHMHHLSGPMATPANGYQFTLLGNAVDGGSVETKFKWGIAVHASHYGSIKDNVVYNYNGAAIATEDGSESFNVFDHNFALRGMGEPSDAVSEARMAMGTEGVGFWFRGPNNYVKNNVAANYQNPTTEAAYGYAFQFRYLGNIAVPKFKGAMNAADFTTKDGNTLPILQFENNEAYGAMQGGFTYWWVSSQDPVPSAAGQESLIKDLKLWNIYNKTIYHYPTAKMTFDGLTIRGNWTSASRCCGHGVYFGDYSATNIIIRNSDIQGVRVGIEAPVAGFGPGPNLRVENTYLRNNTNLLVGTNWSVNGCWMQDKLVEIRNTRFDAVPGGSLSIVSMGRANSVGIECLSKLDEVRVYAYNGNTADNFQVYHSNAAVLPRPPGSCTPVTRAGITSGVTCPLAAQGPVVPTATLSASPTSIASGQAATLTWSTTNATTVAINQGVGTVAASGTRSVSPTASTTYTLTATNAAGSATATATVTVTASTNLLVQDSFVGASGTLLTAHVPDVNLSGNPWVLNGGVPMPTLDAGGVGVGVGGGHLQATINSGVADVVLAVDYRVGAGPGMGALAFRLTDTNNYFVLETYLNGLHLYRREAGVWVFVASQPLPQALLAGSVHRLEVRTQGSTIEGWWNGVRLLQVIDSFQVTATRHGLDWNSAFDATSTYDNFQLRVNGTVSSSTPPSAPTTPAPATGATGVSTTAGLTWTAVGATSYDVRVGTTTPLPTTATGLTAASYVPASMTASTTYFWQVIARNGSGTTAGPVWSFTTAVATVPTGLLIQDSFVGASGTLLTAHVPDVNLSGNPWVLNGGVPMPTLDAGGVGVGVGGGHLQATINSGVADVVLAVDYRVGAGPGMGALAFRLTDTNNYFVLETYLNGLHLYRREAGVWVFVASQPLPQALLAGSVHRLEVRTQGSTIEGWWNGVRLLQVIDSFQVTATRHGLDWNSAFDATSTYDNFQLRVNGTVSSSTPPSAPTTPAPATGATGVSTTAGLTWTAVGATSYDVRVGTTTPLPTTATGLTAASYVPASMTASTTYFWQVIARNGSGTTAGPVWSFTTAVATVPTGLLIQDSFVGASGTLLTAHVPDVNLSGNPWVLNGGVPMPTLDAGGVGVGVGGGHLQATINSGVADVVLAVDYRVGAGPGMGALAFRLTDTNNYFVLETYLNGLHLYRREAGVWVFVASQPLPQALLAGGVHRLEVRTQGSTIEGWWNGVRLLQVIDSFQVTATRHGLDWNSAYDMTSTYDNFQLSVR